MLRKMEGGITFNYGNLTEMSFPKLESCVFLDTIDGDEGVFFLERDC